VTADDDDNEVNYLRQ